jgi:hypothetical protein
MQLGMRIGLNGDLSEKLQIDSIGFPRKEFCVDRGFGMKLKLTYVKCNVGR